MPPPPRPETTALRALPRGIWALGIVSLLMDTSSELIHSVLPLYLATVLGAPATAIGILEGAAEATAAAVRVFSGALTDRLGRRKALALAGYGLAALAKPVFPLAASVAAVAAARITDRIGKGIRGAPRDALVAELAPPARRGAAFGLRQALDSTGAVAGPLLAFALLAAAIDLRDALWVAVVPAWLAVAVLALGVREPAAPAAASARPWPLRRAELRRLGAPFWRLAGVAAAITAARTTEAFLLLRADSAGVPGPWVPAVLAVMSAAYAAGAYPAGSAADRVGRYPVLLAGVAVLVLTHAMLALATGPGGIVLGAVLWGLHLAATQGVLAAVAVDACPPDRRGTALGVLGLVTAVALLAGGAGAGLVWESRGPASTFGVAAAVALLALGALAATRVGATSAR